MDTYKEALNAFLKLDGNSESALADQINSTQVTINRYRNGRRFPDAGQARLIEDATDGQVPFELWQREFMERAGITPEQAGQAA